MKTAGIRKLGLIILSSVLFLSLGALSKVDAATLSFTPSSGSYAVGDTIELVVELDGEGELVDSVDLVIEYDTDKLTFVSVTEMEGSIGTNTEAGGTMLVGVTGTGYLVDETTTTSDLIKLTFTAKAAGTDSTDYAVVSFVTEGALTSSVPSESDLSELLTTTNNGSYTITTSSSTDDNDDDDDDDSQVGKGATAPSTGIFDSLPIGLIAGITVMFASGIFSLVASKSFKE